MNDSFLLDNSISMFFGILLLAGVVLTFFRFVLYDALIIIFYYIKSNVSAVAIEDIKRIEKYLKNFQYYQALSSEAKQRFCIRVFRFMTNKDFIGRHRLEVTEEMKAFISASAVQLTFGLNRYRISHFHTIWIYPEEFYSKMIDANLKGGASPAGKLMFSWKDFLDGYEDPDDKYNLGLHEMAHALKLDVIKGSAFDELFASYIDNWFEIGSIEFENMKQGRTSFLRSYGGTNMHEFFAVCIEHFFEVPNEMKQNLPDIYNHLCLLLNQDPSNIQGDFVLTESYKLIVNSDKKRIPFPDYIRKTLKYHSWHWTLTVVMFAFFLGYPILYLFMRITVLDFPKINDWMFGISIAGLFQYFFLKRRGLSGWIFLPYNFFGFPIAAFIIVLLLNMLIPLTTTKTEEYNITGFYYETGGTRQRSSGESAIVALENGAYHNYPLIRTFYVSPEEANPYCASLRLRFATGIFGIKTLRGYSFVCVSNVSDAGIPTKTGDGKPACRSASSTTAGSP